MQVNPAAISPNTFYNPTPESYNARNPLKYNPVGGLSVFNYPMYFDSYFTGNLFDRFHDAEDNPLKSLESHQSFELDAFLCCELMDALGAWEGDFAKIGYPVKLESRNGYDIYGRVEHFEVMYEQETIRITGKKIMRKT